MTFLIAQSLAALSLGALGIGGPLWLTRDFPWLGETSWHGLLAAEAEA